MALTTKRLNWLKWLYPGEAGLQNEQNWHIDKRRGHMGGDHNPGISTGLNVLASGSPDLNVHVQPGRGIDAAGEEILTTSIVDLNLSSYASGGGTAYIVAEYDQQGSDPYIVPETSASQNKFWEDNVQITHQGTPAAGNQIELARVVVSNGATTIDDPGNPANPLTDEIDQRNRVSTFPFLDTPERYNGLEYDLDENGAPNWVAGWPGRWEVASPEKGNLDAQLGTAVNYRRIFLMPGTYSVANSMTLTGATIVGRNVIVQFAAVSTKITMNAGSTLFGLRFDAGQDDTSTPMIDVTGEDNSIEKCSFPATGYQRECGVRITDGVLMLKIEQCYFEGVAGGTGGADIKFDWTTTAPQGVTITQCRFEYNDSGTSTLSINGDPNSANATAKVTIENCYFVSPNSALGGCTGIIVNSGFTIRQCRFKSYNNDTMRGITIASGANVIGLRIEGCEFVDVLNGPIYLVGGGAASKNWVIDGNFVYLEGNYYSAASAMYVQNCKWGLSIVNNTVFRITGTGSFYIYVTGSASCVIAHNRVTSIPSSGSSDGIRVQSSDGAFVGGNYIEVRSVDSWSSSGITVSSSSYVRIVGNFCVVEDEVGTDFSDWNFGIYADVDYSTVADNVVWIGSDNTLEDPSGWAYYISGTAVNITGNMARQIAGAAQPTMALIIAGGAQLVIDGNHLYYGFSTNYGIDGTNRGGIYDGNIIKSAVNNMTGYTVGSNRVIA